MANGWEIIAKLGSGGQGEVFKALSPQAAKDRNEAAQSLLDVMRNQTPLLSPPEARQDGNTIREWWLKAMPDLVRKLLADHDPANLGALKRFQIPDADPERSRALVRLEQEVAALREHKHPAILRLRDANVGAHEIVTEYHPLGTLEEQRHRFRRDVGGALAALLPVVEAVARLHQAKVVHRDIKLANIFVAQDGRLVLGDFGIVFYRDAEGTRVTSTYESAGSHDWMPPWVSTGQRLEDVPASFDVFALGKVLWCMISGERMLPFWYHRKPEHDLERKYPRDPEMAIVNVILDTCVVEDEERCCGNAQNLFEVLSEALYMVRRGGVMLRERAGYLPCRVCARGQYVFLSTAEGAARLLPLAAWKQPAATYQPSDLFPNALTVRVARCTRCGHLEMFECHNGVLPEAWQ